MRVLLAQLMFCVFVAGCGGGSSNGESETAVDSDQPPVVSGSWYQPALFATWQWQLSGPVNSSYEVDIYYIDMFDSSESLIQQLQLSSTKVICYFSAGSYEAWRSDASSFSEAELGNTLDGWADERWLDIRSENVRAIMKRRLDLAVEKGCDGVEADNVDGYSNNSGFNLSASDQLDFNRMLANEAHTRGLSVGLKNDLDQVDELVEQCFEYSECDVLSAFVERGKAVLNAEYRQEYIDDEIVRNTLCNESLNLQFSTLILPLDLDDEFRFGCL
ncbi:MAG: endo alpha-1,4 polygalactosaminidase [Candidatus Thiodiazotropha sp. 6PLUC3]